jgi:hypothetical protein
MKNERIELFKKVANEELTPEQADEQLLGLFSVRISLLRDKIETAESHWVHKIGECSDEAQHEMEGYHWALNDVNGILHSNES